MRELSLDRLRTLVTIADLGSFAAAAQALHLAPPTVSLHIAELEQRIGAPLLLRRRGQGFYAGTFIDQRFLRSAIFYFHFLLRNPARLDH